MHWWQSRVRLIRQAARVRRAVPFNWRFVDEVEERASLSEMMLRWLARLNTAAQDHRRKDKDVLGLCVVK